LLTPHTASEATQTLSVVGRRTSHCGSAVDELRSHVATRRTRRVLAIALARLSSLTVVATTPSTFGHVYTDSAGNTTLRPRLHTQPVVKMVVQPVQRVVQPVVKPVEQPVEQPAASCKQTFNLLSNRLFNRFDKQPVVSCKRGFTIYRYLLTFLRLKPPPSLK